MTDTRGTFRLKNVRNDILNNQYVPIPNVWIGENQSVGYTKMYGAAEYKFNFSTSTTTTSTIYNALAANKYLQAGTSNPTYAWFVGGQPGPLTTSIKITYATDTAADNPSSRIAVAKHTMGAISGESHSYFVGGGPGGYYSTVSKLTHSNDTTVDLPGSHLAAGKYMKSTGHGGGAHAYIFRGMPGSGANNNTTTERITFANDTRSSLPSSSDMATVSSKVPYWGAGNLQCSTHCYYAGGVSGGSTIESIFQKLTFSNETWAVNPSYMTQKIRYVSGMTANSSKGYIAGGLGPGYRHDVDSVAFATDTWAGEPSMDLPSSIPGTSQNVTYGGSEGTTLNDSLHPGPSGLPTVDSRWSDGAPASLNTGYSYEGSVGNNAYKTNLSTDTAAATSSANQSVWKKQQAALSNQDYGWIGGGMSPSAIRTMVDKTTYSTDTLAQLPGTNLSVGIYNHTAICDGTAGWFLGGQMNGSPSYNTNYYKLSLSSDTMSTPGSQIHNYNYRLSATNSLTAGYSSRGATFWTSVEKFVFSTESPSVLPSVLPYGTGPSMYNAETQGTQTFGYWAGGFNGSTGGGGSHVVKMGWATETGSSLPTSGYLSQGRYGMSSLGNTTDAYWMGGSPTSPARTVEKLNYATETSSVNPSLAPSPIKDIQENVSYGARAKGIPVSLPPIATPTAASSGVPVNFGLRVMCNGSGTNVGKIDFTTDSTSKLTDQPGTLTAGDGNGGWNDNSGGKMVYGTQGAGPNIFGLPYTTGTVSTISTAPISPGLNAAIYKVWTYSTTHGFFSGGRSWSPSYPSHHTNTSRYTFSTDTIQTSYPSQRLVHAVERAKGVANSTHGYVTGGRTDNPGAYDRSYVQKASFSTGDFAQVPSANLNAVTTGHNLTGNLTSARIAGKVTYSGQTDESRFQKLTYSNDTTTTLPGSTLPGTPSSSHGRGLAATGNQTQGYFGSSTNISPATNVKIVYATDTTSETPAYAYDATTRDTLAKSAGEQNGSGKAPSPNLI